ITVTNSGTGGANGGITFTGTTFDSSAPDFGDGKNINITASANGGGAISFAAGTQMFSQGAFNNGNGAITINGKSVSTAGDFSAFTIGFSLTPNTATISITSSGANITTSGGKFTVVSGDAIIL